MTDLNQPTFPQIDIDAVIQKRNPKLKRLLPGFVMSYIKYIAHQEEMNGFLRVHGDKFGFEFLEEGLKFVGVPRTLNNWEHLPKGNRYVIAANHPLGGIDGISLLYELIQHLGHAKVIANDLLMNIVNLRPLFVGVNSFGHNSRDHLKDIEASLASDENIIIFPAGLVSRRINGVVKDLEWKKTFIQWSTRYQRDVVPIHISGQLSNFFYNLSNIRKKLGVKANIEMFYLAHEMFLQRGKPITMTCGKPIPYTSFDNSRKPNEWAHLVQDHIYKLPKNGSIDFIK